MNAQASDNSQLVALSLGGDHEAFRDIVERYQNIVCALAFSACGNAAKSEDLTQETFLIAWQRLRELQEPANLKAWLCGIVRNLARNMARKRIPATFAGVAIEDAEDAGVDPVDDASSPHDQAADREEAGIVEQALFALPDKYREPLVLFYREDQSIKNVAEAMDLSQDAVRQRLSRGRSMLRDQMEAVIERSLRRTKPTSALTIAIIAALPGVASQAKAAIVAGTAAKAVPAIGKSFWSFSLLGALASPLISLAAIPLMARAAERAGKSPREKRYLVRFNRQIGFLVLATAVAISVISFDQSFMLSHPIWYGILLAASILVLVGAVLILSLRADKRLKQIRLEDQQ
jgi:RNA polymerase sigma factor (sigma-70 family)